MLKDIRSLTADERMKFQKVVPARLFLTVVYSLSDGRNAWWSTWTSYSYGFSDTLGRAKSRAESNRVQGTTFTISALPGAAIAAPTHTLITTGISPEPLTEMGLGKVLSSPDCTFERIFAAIETQRSVVGLIGETDQLGLEEVDPEFEFKMWDSSSSGGEYLLNWTPRLRQRELARKLVETCRGLIAQAIPRGTQSG